MNPHRLNQDDDLRAPIIGIDRHRIQTDGQGVTTLVGFHGCPLYCRYCLNDQCHYPEGIYRILSPEELYEEVKLDDLYFLATGGGITFGGGEPCLQSRFIRKFRECCGPQWKINVETCLNISRSHLELLVPVVDQYIIDIKETNSHIYRRYTKVDNQQMLHNLSWLLQQVDSSRILIRIPRIPHFNTQLHISRSIAHLKSLGITRFDVFSYQIKAPFK